MIWPLLLLLGGWDEDHYQRGMELARAERWEVARQELEAGQAEAPRDKRYPLELAGLEYRRRNYAAARKHLRKALRIDPQDRYGNDFLGTLYFLDENLEAALKYWNRIGKPRIENVTIAPQPAVDAVLLDRAMAFSPASVLVLNDLRTSKARLDALDIFCHYNFELMAQPEERFEARLRWLDCAGWMRAASVASGLPYQTLYADFRNVGGAGINWTNMLRWDAQKRRALVSIGGPVARNPKWQYRLYADARRETWNLDAPEDFRLEKVESGAQIRALPSGRLSWNTGVVVALRHFRNAPEFRGGTSAKYRVGVDYELLSVPERRFTLGASARWELGRMFSGSRDLFSQGQGGLAARWFPQSRGSDYQMNARVRAGKTLGHAPFDELFMLGVERDNDLWLRGHAGTRGGKKGSAPISRNYVLAGWEVNKDVYRHALFTFSAGPFVDAGRIRDVHLRFGSKEWLVDSGVQGKVRVLGALAVVVSYGLDLRSGGRALYATVEQRFTSRGF